MYCGDDVSSVVVDIGSYHTRAGYSGEDCPRSVIPSLVGLCNSQVGEDVEMVDTLTKKRVIVGGAELNFKRDAMEIQPLCSDQGIINFDYLEDILKKSLIDQLMINPKETPFLFTESPIHNKEQRLKLTEFMFEKFQVPAIFICKAPVLAAFSCGRATAVILDSGFKQTTATPVHEGFALQKCIIKHDIGGHYITQELMNSIEKKVNIMPRFAFKKRLINNNGQEGFDLTKLDTSGVHPSYYNWSKEEIVKDIKEELLYVSEDPVDDRALETIRSAQYELPDGQQITLQSERLSLTEKLFQPNDRISSGGFIGLHQMIVESIGKADIDIRRDLFGNVVVAGGNTLYKNFLERLQRQIPEISPQNVKVKVVSGSGGGSGSSTGSERKFSSWVGGSILSSLGSFQQMWMSRQEFDEHGAIMIERKCA